MAFPIMGCVVLLVVIQGPSRPAAPRFLSAPSFRTTSEPIHLIIWSDPHPARMAVIAEIWTIEDETEEGLPIELALVRSSSEPAEDTRKTFRFAWHSLPEGSYLLYARIMISRGLTHSSPAQRLEIR